MDPDVRSILQSFPSGTDLANEYGTIHLPPSSAPRRWQQVWRGRIASRDTARLLPTVLTLRDWDLLHKPPMRKGVTWVGFNKVAYLTYDGTVIYPYGRRLRRTPLAQLSRQSLGWYWEASPLWKFDNVEALFTKNADNARLFFVAIDALMRGRLEYFDNPIKLPRLLPISQAEYERRWAQLSELIQPVDLVCSCDNESRISRLITRLDHGPWSHTFAYIGDGRINEATPPVVRETNLEIYHSPRYRLGVYRAPGPVTDEQTRAFVAFGRAQLGKPYAYSKALRLSLWKLFDRIPDFQGHPFQLSPNDLAVYHPLRLVHVV